MRETERDLLEVVREYLQRVGREDTERNRLNAIYTNPNWMKRWPAYKAAQKKAAMNAPRQKPTTKPEDQALVEQWLAMRNEQIKKYNESLTTGIGLPKLEIGYANFQITFEKALYEAREWFSSRQQEYDDTVTAAGRARVQYIESENQRANNLIHRPIDQNDPIYLKYKIRLTPLTDQQLDDYSKWPVDDLRKGIEFTKSQAALNINLNGPLTEHEWACVTRFVQTNNLDPMGVENFETAALLLAEHNVIRRKDLGPVTVDIEPPKLPEPIARPVVEPEPQGRAAEQSRRERDTIRDCRKVLNEYLIEIEQGDEPVPDGVVFAAYDSLLKTRTPIDRRSVRKAVFYATLKTGRKPSGYLDDEIESFIDQTEMQQVSAEEYKRQMALYGDVRLGRVPSKENALLEQIVKNTTRKS